MGKTKYELVNLVSATNCSRAINLFKNVDTQYVPICVFASAAVICVTLVDRLAEDVPMPHNKVDEWPGMVVMEYIRRQLESNNVSTI